MYAQIARLTREVALLWDAINSKGSGSGSGSGGGGSGATISQGTAAPEGSVTGNKNDMYHQISGGILQRSYVKTTNGGNTGWV